MKECGHTAEALLYQVPTPKSEAPRVFTPSPRSCAGRPCCLSSSAVFLPSWIPQSSFMTQALFKSFPCPRVFPSRDHYPFCLGLRPPSCKNGLPKVHKGPRERPVATLSLLSQQPREDTWHLTATCMHWAEHTTDHAHPTPILHSRVRFRRSHGA